MKADFNADGKPDVAAANNFSSEVSVLAGDGNGGFLPPITLSVPEHPVAIATADFNNDGRADLAVAGFTDIQGSGSVSVLLGNGSGGWQFWLNKLNQFNGDFIQAEMVKAFLSSDEYRNRFGQ